jgi:hypothetical protein
MAERFPKTLYVTKDKDTSDEVYYTGFEAFEEIPLDDHAGDVLGVYKLVEVKVLQVERSLR